ncbi:MFS transporter [Acrocarpospora phusangensis]|uniref:MFS transporter n=1 Tax=Acrocarpospora phusangensis TaxID=1070424 RepID=A0A919UUW9_9ACTN|nr:MFS transporter [Acrocarpospora phusangensis]GIH28820.1 MFS transporter [Acrocarpospora phusangensis]
MGRRRTLIFWLIGVLAYAAAVFQRQTLGVSGLDAAERFGLGAAGLSVLGMLQLLVYAAMQIPVGILVDRFGSKRMLLTGALIMASGQLLFAVSTGPAGAIAARVLVGCGDAMTFISVIRMINLYFPAHRNPLMVQVTGLLGALGGIAAAVPLITALHRYGWTPTFLGAAGLSALALVVVLVALREGRPDPGREPRGVRAAWAEPGTRLGMWTHAATQSSGAAFLLLWGYPFLVTDQGLGPQAAGGLITALTVLSLAYNPLFGWVAGRFPTHRSRMVLLIVGSTAVSWTVVLLWPGPAPAWVLIAHMVVLAANGPGSVIGFDYARTFNPAERIGVAAGIVNGGGFLVTVTLLGLIGVGLDLHGDFRLALAAQYPIWGLAAWQVLRYRTRTGIRTRLAEAPA